MLTEQEFIKAIQEHEHIIHKVCNIYAHTQTDREDLFQETVLNAWKGVKQFRNESKFSTWLYRVALNTAITVFKKEKAELAVRAAQKQVVSIEEAPYQEEQLTAMNKAIAELSDIEKALVLLYFEDCSHQEMAVITGITINNVAVKMNRIKAKLRASTKKYLE